MSRYAAKEVCMNLIKHITANSHSELSYEWPHYISAKRKKMRRIKDRIGVQVIVSDYGGAIT